MMVTQEVAMIFKPQRVHGEPPAMTEEHPAEARLEQRVAGALAVSDGVGTEGLRVVADGGEIFLFGSIASRADLDRAVEVVLAVPGVQKVTTRLDGDEAL
jgi:osmotically-inducible protein OsmY